MATKKQLPLKSLNGIYSSAIHTVDGHNYACWTLNIGSKDALYDFIEPIFPFHCMTATGWSDGNSTWFLATTPEDENGKLFDLVIKKQGDWKVVDETATKEAVDAWLKTGRLIAIDCKDLPGLKVLAEFLHENKLFVKGDMKIKIKPTESDPLKLKGLIKEFFEFYRENKRFANSSKGENVEPVMGVVGNYGVLRLVLDEPGHGLPEVDEIDPMTGLPTGEKTIQSVPFTGSLEEIEKVIFSPPQVIQKSVGGKNYSNGSSVNVEGYKPTDAWSFIKTNSSEICDYFESRFGLNGSDLALVVLSLSGVPALPQFSNPKAYAFSHHIELENLHDDEKKEITSNGNVVPTPAEDITLEISREENFVNYDQLRSLMKTEEKKGGLALTDEQCDSWFKLHNKKEEDIHNMLVIISSNAWRLQRKDVSAYLSNLQFGQVLPGILPTVLNSENIAKLYELVNDFDAKFAIDQSAKFSEMVAA